MKQYKATVVFRYYMEMTVEAEDEDKAQQAMCERFRLSNADCESEVLDLEEVK